MDKLRICFGGTANKSDCNSIYKWIGGGAEGKKENEADSWVLGMKIRMGELTYTARRSRVGGNRVQFQKCTI